MATTREMLWEQATGRYGYVTSNDIQELGLPAVTLGKLHARGALTKIGRGLYRFPTFPATVHDQFAEAVLLVGRSAYLTHDAVLAFHNLAQVNPTRIRVGTPFRVQAQIPQHIEVIRRDLPDDAITEYEGIPSTTVAQAILDCQETVMRERLLAAVRAATAEGLMTPMEARSVRAKLRRASEGKRR